MNRFIEQRPRRGITRRTAIVVLMAGAVVTAAGGSRAEYPAKPIQIIVPWPAGGLVDLPARLLADKARVALGQQVIVENRTGAGGSIGADAVAKAAPDGHTLLVTTSAMTMNQALRTKQPFDAIADFQPIALLGTAPSILIAAPSKGFASVADFLVRAKKEPGKLTYASAGQGTPSHLATEWLKASQSIDILHVPYKGGPQAMTDVLAGRVDVHFTNSAVGLPQIRAGKVKALAVTSSKRLDLLPDVPTMAEAGVSDFIVEQWIGLLAPKGTPPDIVKRLNEVVRGALAASDVRATMSQAGIVPGEPASAQAFAALVQRDLDRWSAVVKSADIKVD